MKKSKKTIIIVILVIIILLVLLLRGCRKDVMVTFQSYGSSNEVRVSDDGTIDRIEDPKRDGYRFLGWYLDGELFDFDTKITEDNIGIAHVLNPFTLINLVFHNKL